MGIVDDVLDFLAFIVLMGVSLAVAFGVILPTLNDFDATSQVKSDKTAPMMLGESSSSTFDGTMSKQEVVLLTQVQDSELPYPKRYKVSGHTEEVSEMYKETSYLSTIGVYIGGLLDDSQRYKINYNYSPTNDLTQDFYSIDTVNIPAGSENNWWWMK